MSSEMDFLGLLSFINKNACVCVCVCVCVYIYIYIGSLKSLNMIVVYQIMTECMYSKAI